MSAKFGGFNDNRKDSSSFLVIFVQFAGKCCHDAQCAFASLLLWGLIAEPLANYFGGDFWDYRSFLPAEVTSNVTRVELMLILALVILGLRA